MAAPMHCDSFEVDSPNVHYGCGTPRCTPLCPCELFGACGLSLVSHVSTQYGVH